MKRISTSIILAITLCVVGVSVLIGAVNGVLTYNAMEKEATEKLEAMSLQYRNELNLRYNAIEEIVTSMNTYIASRYDGDRIRDTAYNQSFMKEFEKYLCNTYHIAKDLNILRLYALIEPKNIGEFIFTKVEKGKVIREGQEQYDSFSRRDGTKWNFYNQTLKNNCPTWLDPYEDEELMCQSISYSQPVYIEKQLVGVVGLVISFNDFKNIVDSIKPYGQGYAFLVDSYQRFITHKQFKRTDKLSTVGYHQLQKMLEIHEEDIGKMKIEGKDSYVAYSKLGNGYHLVMVVPVYSVMKNVTAMLLKSFCVVLLAFVICSFIAIALGKRISMPIAKVTEDIELAKEGDYTGQSYLPYMKKKDETGKLARAIDKLQKSMGTTVAAVNGDSALVTGSAVALTKTIASLVDEVGDITATAEELSASMQQTTSTTIALNNTSEHMLTHMNHLNNKNKEGVSTANNIKDRAVQLKNEAIESSRLAEDMCKSTDIKLKVAIENSKQVQKINELSEAILKIADQTNLLSINASIEATKAGEYGRGFGVVASEIRTLADNSEKTALQIQEIVNSVIVAVNNLCSSSAEVIKFMDTHVKATYVKLLQLGDQYSRDSLNMEILLQDIDGVSNRMFLEIDSLLHSVAELTSATSEGTKGIMHIAKNAEDVESHTNEVKEQVDQLLEISNNLEEVIAVFRTNA